jgi:hypothetical protein
MQFVSPHPTRRVADHVRADTIKGIFWVLWLAVGAVATAAGVFKECNFADCAYIPRVYRVSHVNISAKIEMICRQFPAIQGLAFFNWLLRAQSLFIIIQGPDCNCLVFGWWITLWVMVFLLRRKQADNQNNKSMWRQSVAEARMSISAPIPQDGAHNTRYGIQPHGTDNIAMKRTEHPVKETQAKGGSLYDRFRSRSGVNAV